MSRDASLAEFSAGDESESSGNGDSDALESEAERPRPFDDDIEPATSTCEFDPETKACQACGTPVARRWQQDGDLVCPDCKEW